jgi:hypothetical protein
VSVASSKVAHAVVTMVFMALALHGKTRR